MTWGNASMGSYAEGTRDVLTEWHPTDQAFAAYLLDQRPDIATYFRAQPASANDSEANILNRWAFGHGTDNWYARNPGMYASEIQPYKTLLEWARQVHGWEDSTPVTTFSDGSKRTQAQMGSELWRSGWTGDQPPALNQGETPAAILAAYLRTTGRSLPGGTTSDGGSSGGGGGGDSDIVTIPVIRGGGGVVEWVKAHPIPVAAGVGLGVILAVGRR